MSCEHWPWPWIDQWVLIICDAVDLHRYQALGVEESQPSVCILVVYVCFFVFIICITLWSTLFVLTHWLDLSAASDRHRHGAGAARQFLPICVFCWSGVFLPADTLTSQKCGNLVGLFAHSKKKINIYSNLLSVGPKSQFSNLNKWQDDDPLVICLVSSLPIN